MKNPKIMFGSVLLALACFAVSSTVLAVPRPTSTAAGEDRGNGKGAAGCVDAPNLNTLGLNMRDKEGTINAVRYEQFNAMLLNEFLKKHKTFVEEQVKVTKFETGLTALLATVKEQAAQIENVSAQHESHRPRQTLARNIP